MQRYHRATKAKPTTYSQIIRSEKPRKYTPPTKWGGVIAAYVNKNIASRQNRCVTIRTRLIPASSYDAELLDPAAEKLFVIKNKALTSMDIEFCTDFAGFCHLTTEAALKFTDLQRVADKVFEDGRVSWSRVIGMLQLIADIVHCLVERNICHKIQCTLDWLAKYIECTSIGSKRKGITIANWVEQNGKLTGLDSVIRRLALYPLQTRCDTGKEVPSDYIPFQCLPAVLQIAQPAAFPRYEEDSADSSVGGCLVSLYREDGARRERRRKAEEAREEEMRKAEKAKAKLAHQKKTCVCSNSSCSSLEDDENNITCPEYKSKVCTSQHQVKIACNDPSYCFACRYYWCQFTNCNKSFKRKVDAVEHYCMSHDDSLIPAIP